MRGPYSVELHPCHPDQDWKEAGEDVSCDVAYVRGYDNEGVDVEVCTVYRDGSKQIAERIAAVLTASESSGNPKA